MSLPPKASDTKARARRRRRWIALGLLLGAVAWALTLGRAHTKRALARGIRAVAASPGDNPRWEAREDDRVSARPTAIAHAVSDAHDDTESLHNAANLAEADAVANPESALVELPQIGPQAPPKRAARPAGLRGVSFVLLLGFDNRSEKITGRTDTMIIGAFRERDGKVAAFSIPRDLWIEIPELGPARISSVYRIGEVKLGRGEGLPLLQRVLEAEFGVRIDHYAGVDLQGFVALVDAIGGVDVDVQCPIVDCFWASRDAESCEMLTLEAGRQRLDGRTALMFARSRHGRGDRDRTRRQQSVVVAFGRKVVDRGVLRLSGLWDKAKPHVRTDLQWDSAAYYASFALETPLSELGGFSITKPIVERHVTPDNKHVLLLQREAFNDALRRAFDTPMPALKPKRRCPAADVALHPKRRK